MTESERHTVLILSISAGHGHLRPAEALRAAGERYFPEARVVHHDALGLINRPLRWAYAAFHTTMMKRQPALLGRIYDRIEANYSGKLRLRASTPVLAFGRRRFLRTLRALRPAHVISTHCLATELAARLAARAGVRPSFWVVENDYGFHGWWLHDAVSGYFVPAEEVVTGTVENGVEADRVHLTGLPVMPEFATPPSREECAAELGLDPARQTVLMMSGGGGIGAVDDAAERLLELGGDSQLVVMAGSNARLLERLRQVEERNPGRLTAVGFTERVARVMACADLVISKPGGSTVAECLALGLPMVMLSPQPGLEDRNAAYLLERGAAVAAYDTEGLAYRVSALLEDPQRLQQHAAAARRLGRPYAAREILSVVLGVD